MLPTLVTIPFLATLIVGLGNISDPTDINLLDSGNNPEDSMTTIEIIQYYGYPAENHTVITADGYILELHRIPQGTKNATGPRTPVMLQHGVLGSTADWALNPPSQSLAFILADAGYDVWLTSLRGDTYGRKHVTLNPDRDVTFWKFTWDQMAEFDLPAHIDYILNYTCYTELYYVGHSMGTTVAFALLASKPYYNTKIKLFQALAPITTVENAKSPVMIFSPLAFELNAAAQLLGVGELLPSNEAISELSEHCDNVVAIACSSLLFIVMGYDQQQLNQSRMDVYLSHYPSGTSSWTLIHYLQVRNVHKFQRFNWGPLQNQELYGQLFPPEYDLDFITAPTILYWGENDLLSDPNDVQKMSGQLPNVKKTVQVGDEYWAHQDFVLAINASSLLYTQVIQEMPRF